MLDFEMNMYFLIITSSFLYILIVLVVVLRIKNSLLLGDFF